MKEIARRSLAMLLVLVMCFSLMGVPAMATESQEESTVSASSGESIVPEEGYFGVLEDEMGETEEEGALIELGASTASTGTGEILGSAEPEVLDSEGLIESDEDLGIEEDFVIDDETLQEAEAQDDVDVLGEEEDDDLGWAGFSITAAPAATVLNLNNASASRTINVSYNKAPKNGKVCVSVWKNLISTSDVVSCKWGTPSGKSIPLTISANKTGSCYVVVFLCDSYGIPWAQTAIKVNVCRASLSVPSNLTVNQGATKTVNLTASGYSGASQIVAYTSNTAAFTASLGTASGGTVPLKIKGNTTGSGRVTVYYQATTTGEYLASASFPVTVTTTATPKLTVSPSSVSLEPGNSRGVAISYSGYSGSVYYKASTTNSAAYTATWNGGWNGNSRTLNIKGNANGSGKIYVYMYASSTNALLASATISVSVAAAPVINASTSSLKLSAGGSGSVTYTFQNAGGLTPGYTISNPAICSVAWSKTSSGYKLTVAGKNAGSTNISVWLKNGNGAIVKSTNLAVTVAAAPPRLAASASSMSLTGTESVTVKFSYYNCSEDVYLSYSRSNSSVCSVYWGSWAGNSINMTVTGASPGTCVITVGMYRVKDNKLLTSTTVNVKVEAKGSSVDISKLSYSFSNYGQYYISRSLCQKMYGNTQVAENIYRYNLGDGGVCFGMAASAGMMYEGKIPVSTFKSGATKVSQLAQTNASSSMGLTLKDFIECMHVAQAATAMYKGYGINNVVANMMSEIDHGRVVYLGIRGQINGQEGGHRVMAYDYTLNGNTLTFSIYDPNYPLQRKTMTMTRPNSTSNFNTWTYDLTSSITWGSGRPDADINYVTYATMCSVWDKRGKLSSTWNSESKWYNLVLTTESDFTLSAMDSDWNEKMVAKMEAGVLTDDSSEEVISIPLDGVLPDGTIQNSGVYMLLVPRDYYFVQDDDNTDGISISIVDDTLSATVKTDAYTETFGLCADDSTEEASVSMVSGVSVGVGYTVTIGTSNRETGASETISTSGVGTGTSVSLGIVGGNISLGGVADDASLDIATPEITCDVVATAEEGLSVTPAGLTTYSAGENPFYEISADEGYTIAAVYVDGQDVGPVTSWYFEDISESHTIHAVATKNLTQLSSCTVSLSEDQFTYDGEAKMPVVTVTDAAGQTLVENLDYLVCYNENVLPGDAQVMVMAMADSGYCGVLEGEFRIGTSVIETVRAEGKSIEVTMAETAYDEPCVLMAAVYNEDGKMIFTDSKPLQAGEPAIFTLKKDLKANDTIKLFALTAEGYKPMDITYEMTVS